MRCERKHHETMMITFCVHHKRNNFVVVLSTITIIIGISLRAIFLIIHLFLLRSRKKKSFFSLPLAHRTRFLLDANGRLNIFFCSQGCCGIERDLCWFFCCSLEKEFNQLVNFSILAILFKHILINIQRTQHNRHFFYEMKPVSSLSLTAAATAWEWNKEKIRNLRFHDAMKEVEREVRKISLAWGFKFLEGKARSLNYKHVQPPPPHITRKKYSQKSNMCITKKVKRGEN
jgi:hypothetical protein